MKQMGLKCRSMKGYKTTTDSNHNEPVAPNRVWVSDITYAWIGESWYYLSIFLDLFSREIVGWDLSPSLNRDSVIRALHRSLINRCPKVGLMIHSDRGIPYASCEFRQILKGHKFVQSMSRKGNCWDNAVAGSFFYTIKTQLIHHCGFKTVKEARRALFEYIDLLQSKEETFNQWV